MIKYLEGNNFNITFEVSINILHPHWMLLQYVKLLQCKNILIKFSFEVAYRKKSFETVLRLMLF